MARREAHVVTRITIHANPAKVFTYLRELKYHYLWNPQMRQISPLISLKPGATYKTESMVLGKQIEAENVVTKFTPDKELELQNTTGLVHYCANFQLKPRGEKTIVVCSTTASSESPAFAFTKPVLEVLARRELQTDLQALKLAVEHRLESF